MDSAGCGALESVAGQRGRDDCINPKLVGLDGKLRISLHDEKHWKSAPGGAHPFHQGKRHPWLIGAIPHE